MYVGFLKGAWETAAAGHAAQRRDAKDHLPSTLVQSSSPEEGVSGHEEGSHRDSGTFQSLMCLISVTLKKIFTENK